MCANAIAVSQKEGRLLILQNPRKSGTEVIKYI